MYKVLYSETILRRFLLWDYRLDKKKIKIKVFKLIKRIVLCFIIFTGLNIERFGVKRGNDFLDNFLFNSMLY